MNNVFNVTKDKWQRPWNIEAFDDLYNRDERFFAIVVKGLISWLNRNIILYNKSINHFIFNTGSSYLYVESNGYEYSLNETSGEDTMYMELPRCILELNSINIPTEELSASYSRGFYERRSGNMMNGYNAEIKRLPLELTINAKYYLSNFNETIVLLQELLDKIVFQKYFNITYLGQEIQCSIEFPTDVNPEINKIDMTSPEPNQRNISLDFKIVTNYPIINERTEIPTDKVIASFGRETVLTSKDNETDIIKHGSIIDDENNGFNDVIEETNKEYSIIDEDDPNYDVIYENNGCIVSTLIENNEISYIDASYVTNLLEKIKYNAYDEQYDENNDGVINYKDLKEIIQKLNRSLDVNIEYDSFINKLYLIHNNTNETEEIDLSKYKVVFNNE